ncbi:hypothetical protein [Campylobacter lari]|uniref:hypothetical protein n=1 Tax=Campylobacter lari TaxID=201 RepID=UPI000E12660C|nr:hypothetical protein [Campylobacter lari]SUX05511.1 Uncharacterised protein [Campylobacter lari]
MRQKIQKIIFQSLVNLANELENDELKDPNLETKIYGVDGILDSLALVSLVTDLEELLSEEFSREIVLADEKMMSGKNSPFKNVEALVLHIEQLLKA